MSKKKYYKNNKAKAKDTNNKEKKVVVNVQTGFSTLNQVTGAPDSKPYHSKLEVYEPKTLVEPKNICAMCNKPIENIATALLDANNNYVDFDCVLETLKEKTPLAANQSISYIGTGNFAVVEKDEEGKYTIVNRISYEKYEQLNKLRDYIEENKQ